jgi:hypothetical protein
MLISFIGVAAGFSDPAFGFFFGAAFFVAVFFPGIGIFMPGMLIWADAGVASASASALAAADNIIFTWSLR